MSEHFFDAAQNLPATPVRAARPGFIASLPRLVALELEEPSGLVNNLYPRVKRQALPEAQHLSHPPRTLA
jgi:hypothetical protein